MPTCWDNPDIPLAVFADFLGNVEGGGASHAVEDEKWLAHFSHPTKAYTDDNIIIIMKDITA